MFDLNLLLAEEKGFVSDHCFFWFLVMDYKICFSRGLSSLSFTSPLAWFLSCRLFLLGLDKYGKGDWRSISRNFVISRTPTQVASHAQKYFIRLNSMNKDRRRSSIHDITNVSNGDASTPPGPITGQANGQIVNSAKNSKQSSQPPGGPPGVNVYGTTIGQPVGGPIVSAVGTPVPVAPNMAYGVRTPVGGAVVPGAPVNMNPMSYQMPPTSSHRWAAARQLRMHHKSSLLQDSLPQCIISWMREINFLVRSPV